MMGRMLRVVYVATAIVITVVATAAAGLWACNDRIMSADSPKIVRLIVAAFFPPDDLYDFVVRSAIDISQADVKQLDFETKYRGRYEAGILLHKFNPDQLYGTKYTFPLRLKLTFMLGSTPIYSTLAGASASPFIGNGTGGFGLLTIDVPRDIPMGKVVTCRVEIISPDSALAGTYGPAEFFIRKISDK
jgi:hypothetical protein